MPLGPNHYAILGLRKDASSTEIAQAFREKLAALEARPDGGTDEEHNSVRYAYQVLASPGSRAEYDATLAPTAQRSGAAAPEPEEPGLATLIMDVLRESGAIKFVLPVLVLAAIGVFYKLRQPPKEYPAPPRIVETARTIVQEAVKEKEKDDEEQAAPAQQAAAAQSPASQGESQAAAPAGAAAMTAEDIFAAVSPSIGRIQIMDASGKMIGQGSGVVVGTGIVITNCHVVEQAWQISVKVGGKVLAGKVVVADKELDLCSLSVAGLAAPAVTVSGSDARVGERAYAIGAPEGLELTLSEGIVSSLRPTTRGAIIQTTAPISPGSSGGGLFNGSAQLIGVVTFQHKTGQNLNFAVPASWLSEMKHREATESITAPVARSANTPQ
jgi:curved DNA-binding protein CbpA